MRATTMIATAVAATALGAAGIIPAAAVETGTEAPAAATRTTLGPDGTVNRMTVLADGTVNGYTDCTATGKFVAVRVQYLDAWPLRIATYSADVGQRNYDYPAGFGVILINRTQATWHHSATWSASVIGGPDGAFNGWEGVCV
ncbi:hypothetical protein [Kribbella sp. DT2]|uniref:hypothetical protein n=1 Tax=Kribbella sp. DT2 TaxID=3393427 RepID=UPI003CEDEFE2